MTDTELKTATAEILSLGWKDDDGNKMVMTDDTDCVSTIKGIIPNLQKSDFFTKITSDVLAEFGWTRETAGEVAHEGFEPIPAEELANTLEQDIDSCQKIRELKEIALSNPQFKKITGRLSSFDFDSLKLEMLRILNPVEDVPTKLNQKLMDKPIQVAVENFEKEKIQIKDTETILAMKEKRLEAEANIPDEILFGNKEEVIDMPHPETLIGHGRINVKDIVTRPPFNSLFQIDQNILSNILISMKNVGYDPAYPIILWMSTCIDGHTRLQAAKDAGIEEVPVLFKEFKDEHEALEYAMHNQRDRRNITEAELLRCISVIDTPMSKTDAGAVRGEKKEASHKKTAKLLGIGESKVTDARTVLTDEQAIEDVKNAKKTMHEAAEEIRSRKRKPKETIAEALTKVESVIGILKDNAGKEMKLGLLLKQSESLGVKEDMMSLIMEVLTAVNLVKISGDKLSIKKAIK